MVFVSSFVLLGSMVFNASGSSYVYQEEISAAEAVLILIFALLSFSHILASIVQLQQNLWDQRWCGLHMNKAQKSGLCGNMRTKL
jgi:hypothetical protein